MFKLDYKTEEGAHAPTTEYFYYIESYYFNRVIKQPNRLNRNLSKKVQPINVLVKISGPSY